MSNRGMDRRPDGRRGGMNPVVVLLAGIFAAVVVLLGVLVFRWGGGPGPSGATGKGAETVVAEGRTVLRSELPKPPPSPKPVSDPGRIKETHRAGKNYEVVLKEKLADDLVSAGWPRAAANAVVTLNTEWFCRLSQNDPEELNRQRVMLQQLGQFPQVFDVLERRPEIAGLLAQSDDPSVVADSLRDQGLRIFKSG